MTQKRENLTSGDPVADLPYDGLNGAAMEAGVQTFESDYVPGSPAKLGSEMAALELECLAASCLIHEGCHSQFNHLEEKEEGDAAYF